MASEEKSIFPTSRLIRSEIEPRIRNIAKYGFNHFFGMKPGLSKVVKESFC